MKQIALLINTGKTVFSIQDLSKILTLSSLYSIRNFVSHASKDGLLKNLYYGIWGLKKYDELELACKLKKNSYISLDTVLIQNGLIFQYDENTITCVSDNSIQKKSDNKVFDYKKIKNDLLYNPIGIVNHKTYSIAGPERALADLCYLNGQVVDIQNIQQLDVEKLKEIMTIYPQHTQNLLSYYLNHAKSIIA